MTKKLCPILLVGHPNVGKSTLFNALTGSKQRVGNWPGVTVEQKIGYLQVETHALPVFDLPGIYALSGGSDVSNEDARTTLRVIQEAEPNTLFINVIDACHLEQHLYLTSQLLELNRPIIVVLNMIDLAKRRGIEIDLQTLSAKLGCPVVSVQGHREIGLNELKQAIINIFNNSIINFNNIIIKNQADIDATCARYEAAHELANGVQVHSGHSYVSWTEKLDRWVLHRFFALPIFFAAIYMMFFCAIQIGGRLQKVLDQVAQSLFIQYPTWLLDYFYAPSWVYGLAIEGLGKGLQTTVTLIPVLMTMYAFLALLESSGYLARGAFIIDRAMRCIGLPGKAFIPMIVGFGCNVPAIMAARTLDSRRDRILTILMSPFMSCSARLTIYAVFVAAFFPSGGQNIVFSLYLVGIGLAVLTGFLFRQIWFRGQSSPLILELPPYHRPVLSYLWKEVTLRVRYFVIRAGSFIIPVCMFVGCLNAIKIHDLPILSFLGQWLTPLFSPMGVESQNWPATVGLMTGVLAKEVVIGTLNTLYPTSIGTMATYFNGAVGAYAYLLFILLYIPCISTMAAIKKETSYGWMWASTLWSLMIAYAVAVLFYQSATWMMHPQQSLWYSSLVIIGISTIIFVAYWTVHYSARGTHKSSASSMSHNECSDLCHNCIKKI